MHRRCFWLSVQKCQQLKKLFTLCWVEIYKIEAVVMLVSIYYAGCGFEFVVGKREFKVDYFPNGKLLGEVGSQTVLVDVGTYGFAALGSYKGPMGD